MAYYNANKCEHGKKKTRCVTCGGGEICQHKIRRSRCADCGGGEICVHKKQKATCVECNGVGTCQHKMQRINCKICTDPQSVLIRRWIEHSKENDKLRKQETNITREFCATIITESENRCCYCAVELQMWVLTTNLMTIERIDNSIGHVVGNCRVACFHCNCERVGERPI